MLETIETYEPGIFYGGFVKTAHDWLNRDAGLTPAERAKELRRIGNEDLDSTKPVVIVKNKRGDRWALSGDGTLDRSPETLRIASEAVTRTRENVAHAGSIGSSPITLRQRQLVLASRIPQLIERVLELVPHPTSNTEDLLERVEEAITSPSDLASIRGLVAVSESNLDLIMRRLADKGLAREIP